MFYINSIWNCRNCCPSGCNSDVYLFSTTTWDNRTGLKAPVGRRKSKKRQNWWHNYAENILLVLKIVTPHNSTIYVKPRLVFIPKTSSTPWTFLTRGPLACRL